MAYETENWPVNKAKWFTPSNSRRIVRLVVIHSMEAPEKDQTAENVANYFANTPTRASAHICVDNNSIVQCVFDNDVAYAAPGANHDGIQVELAGYANQLTKQWMDEYGVAMLNRAADAVAQYCLKYSLPPRRLTDRELSLPNMKGIVGHDQVTRVYRRSTHTDPGRNFPWDYFIAAVAVFKQVRA